MIIYTMDKRLISIYHFSDPHSLVHKIERVKADLYFCTGDVLRKGTFDELKKFSLEVEKIFKDKLVEPNNFILVPGNHDTPFENQLDDCIQLLKGVEILINQTIERFGIKIHGAPQTPIYGSYSFMDKDLYLGKYWNLIPDDINILLSHGPAYGILDYVRRGINVGSQTLRYKLDGMPNLSLHCFGHIHEGRGYIKKKETYFINGSCPNVTQDPFFTQLFNGYLITYDIVDKKVINVEEVL